MKQVSTVMGVGVRVVAAGLVAGALAGCAQQRPETPSYPLVSQPVVMDSGHRSDANGAVSASLIELSYMSADQLAQQLVRLGVDRLPPNARVLPATFVSLDRLQSASSFGRLLSRQFASRLTQHGMSVVEAKVRQSLLVRRDAGEFLLSRDLEQMGRETDAHAVLVGSYSVAKNRLYVSAQLIRMSDKVAMASSDFNLPMDENIRALLAGQE